MLQIYIEYLLVTQHWGSIIADSWYQKTNKASDNRMRSPECSRPWATAGRKEYLINIRVEEVARR